MILISLSLEEAREINRSEEVVRNGNCIGTNDYKGKKKFEILVKMGKQKGDNN